MLPPQRDVTPALPHLQQISCYHHGRLTIGAFGIQKRLCLLYCRRCCNCAVIWRQRQGPVAFSAALSTYADSDCDCPLLLTVAALASRLQQRPSHEECARRVSSARRGRLAVAAALPSQLRQRSTYEDCSRHITTARRGRLIGNFPAQCHSSDARQSAAAAAATLSVLI
eukprot:TRINITY_DN209_c0_g1_i4.p1 TRINITY_DN209_c0_g1~~TRINITY_DN209_c0_g1_i4.p1  ORF type:complete len:169 (-),score=32.87 TRINITY_DN209_c0_g1_i4:310-816(-)